MSDSSSNRIVCLDLDGVVRLLCDPDTRSYPRDRLKTADQCYSYFDQGCVWQLNRLLHATDARFVIISTQRQLHDWAVLLDAFQHSGIDLDHLHPDANVPWTGTRSRDIEEWMTAHPEVQDWCVIDDELRHYEGWKYLDKVLVPNSRYGLQASTEDKAVRMLLRQPPLREYGQDIPDDTL